MEKIVLIKIINRYITLLSLWEMHFQFFKKAINSIKSDSSHNSYEEVFFEVEIYNESFIGYIDRLIPKRSMQKVPDFKFILNNIKDKSFLLNDTIFKWITNAKNIKEYSTYIKYIYIMEEILSISKQITKEILKLDKLEQEYVWNYIKDLEIKKK